MATANTIIARIGDITSAGESYKNSNVFKNRKDEIEKSFLPVYQTMNTKFGTVLDAYRSLLNIRDVSVDFLPIKEMVDKLKSKVLHDDYDRIPVTSINRELDKIHTELQKNWGAYISEKTASISGVLDTLDKLITGTPEKKMLDTKRIVFSNGSIASPAAIAAINDYITIYSALMDKLDLKDSVLAFIKQLTSGSHVTLSDMNEEVYDWLKKSGFGGKINLNIGLSI